MKKTTVVTALIAAAAASLICYRWFSRPVAEVFPAKRGTAISAVYGTVKVQPTVRIVVRARNSGVIRLSRTSDGKEIAAGMEVKEGWVLGLIEDPELDRELIKVEAELKAGEQKRQLGPPSLQQLKTSEATLGRLEKLAELKNAPASEVERVRNEAQALRERVRSEQLELDRAVTVLSEQLGALRDRKTRCEIKSPLDGLLTAVSVVTGDLVIENSAPFTVSSKTYYLEGQVNEEDVGSLRKKMKAVMQLYAYPHKDFTVTLTDILPAGENQRYLVKLEFEAPPDNLLPGMTGEMNIILGRNENALIIPTRALLMDQVFVVENGAIVPRKVKTGLRCLERTEILEGLKEGDLVVVANHDLFSAGQSVRTIVVNM